MDEDSIREEIRRLLTANRKGMSISEIAQSLNTNRSSTLIILNLLVGSGEVTMRTFGRAKVYTLTSKIPTARLISLSSDLFLILDKDLFIENYNDAFARFFETDQDSLIGSNLQFTTIPDYFSENIVTIMQNALSGEKTVFEEYIGIREEKSFFQITCIPLQQSDLSTQAALVMHDLTIHKKYEETLESDLRTRTSELYESGERFQMLTELAPVGIFQTDADGRWIYVNQNWCETFGFTQDEVQGTGWKQAIHPDDREWIGTVWDDHVREQIPWTMSFRMITKGGKVLHVTGKAVPLRDDSGHLAGFIATVVDLTDRIEAEEVIQDLNEYLNAILHEANDGIAILDTNLNVKIVNPAGLNILGYSSSDLCGKSIRILFYSHESYEQAGNYIYSVFSSGDSYRGDIVIITGDGKERTIEVSLSKLIVKNSFSGVIALFKDVTTRKNDNLEIITHEEQLRSVLDSLQEIVWVIDRNGVILYANQGALHYIPGEQAVSPIGRNISDYYSEHHLLTAFSHFQDVIDTGIASSRKIRVINHGMEYWFVTRATPIQFGKEKIHAALLTALNVSHWRIDESEPMTIETQQAG